MKKEPKKKKLVSIIGIVLLVGLLAFAIYEDRSKSLTGHSIEVRARGFSNYPLSKYPNTVQTEVKITDTNLIKSLRHGHEVTTVANELTRAADFGNTLVNIAQANPPTPIPTDSLSVVIAASRYLTETFNEATRCMGVIGTKYYYESEAKFVVVSDVIWKNCDYYNGWKAAVIRHRYFTPSGQILCNQHGTKLFSQEYITGKISKSTWGC